MKTNLPKVILSIFLMISIVSCDDSGMNDKVDYDRSAFLENFADNLIIPAFSDLNDKVAAFNTAVTAFGVEQSEDNLATMQSTLKEAWLSYQYVAYLEVGPSADAFFRDEVNIFPADTTVINSKIASADYVFTGGANNDVKGFPALDYLINGTGTSDQEILAFYGSSNDGALRVAYLQEVTDELADIASSINAAWPAYRETFVNNLGTDIGSSTGIMVNEFNLQYDLRLKNGKIGIPSGVKSLERVNPDKVEALYGGYSKELAIASAQAAINIFNGKSFGSAQEGEGYDDYLNALGAESADIPLAELINDALALALEETNEIEGTIQDQAERYNADGDLVQAYNALQSVIPLIKVDMTSAMSITITFQDNDGD